MKKIIVFLLVLSVIVFSGNISLLSGYEVNDTNSGTWTSFSIHTREDGGIWEDQLKNQGYFYNTNVTEESGLNSQMAYGENAKISTQTTSGFILDVTSTGWSAEWGPSGYKDSNGNDIIELKKSNPSGITVARSFNVERGRYYNISFKIKSTLQNEIMKEKKRKDGTSYNIGSGEYNYVKHFHFSLFDSSSDNEEEVILADLMATLGGESVLETNQKKLEDFTSFIKLDSKNETNDGWVDVETSIFIPLNRSIEQEGKNGETITLKFLFGTYLKEYMYETNMSGQILVSDFEIIAGEFETIEESIQESTQEEVTEKISKEESTTEFVNPTEEMTASSFENTIENQTTEEIKSILKPTIVKFTLKTSKKKRVTVKWKQKKDINGYTIYYKKVKKGTWKKITELGKTKQRFTTKKLKKGKTYFFTVKAYKLVDGKKVYGKYKTKKIKIK